MNNLSTLKLTEDSTADNMLIHGDSVTVMTLLLKSYAGKVKCVYLDPPYCSNTQNEHYCDIYTADEYTMFIRNILSSVKILLADDGILFFQISAEQSFSVKSILDDVLGTTNFRNQIIVSRNDFKSYNNLIFRLANGYDVIFVYTKNPATKLMALIEKEAPECRKGEWAPFYKSTISNGYRYPLFGITPMNGEWRFDEAWALSAARNYKNILQYYANDNSDCLKDFDNAYQEYCKTVSCVDNLQLLRLKQDRVEYYIPPSEVRYITDNWADINMRGRLTNFEHEVNEKLIERILMWATQEGDIVLDPFLGSGTTVAVATRMHRKWIGIEQGNYCKTLIMERVTHEIETSGNLEWEYQFFE